MNKALLHKEVQDFIQENYKADVSKIVFRGSPFEGVAVQELAVQLVGKRKAEKKLPTWFNTEGIIYPPSLSLEQTSSEVTASYKASLISGSSLVDLTGGFGVDSFFFSKQFEKVFHFELDSFLSELANHNFSKLGAANVETIHGDGIDFLDKSVQKFDWIFIDPSRRDDAGGLVFRLSECLPDVPQHLQLLLDKSFGVMVKTSPLLDLQAGISALRRVQEIHIVAVENDVKELLWILKKDASEEIGIKTINFRRTGPETYISTLGKPAEPSYHPPQKYLYEPNAAIMKSGLFGSLGEDFNMPQLHPNSHLYTSETFRDFPGRSFEIAEIIPYNKKKVKKALEFEKANITTRNFPESVDNLRKQLKLKEGGNDYLFFTTIEKEERICLICKKV